MLNEVLLSLIRLTCIYHDVIENIWYKGTFTKVDNELVMHLVGNENY